MAAAIACASTSLAGLVLRLSSNALTGKVNVGHVSMKAKATDSIWVLGVTLKGSADQDETGDWFAAIPAACNIDTGGPFIQVQC
ncbi:unnamed protein product [Calypogeia fissa]